MSTPGRPGLTESQDFSLVLGGPLYQLLRRSRLTGDTLELLHRRIIALTVVTLAPVVPLTLTMISLEELLTQAIRMVL
jgi:hypothetical protein